VWTLGPESLSETEAQVWRKLRRDKVALLQQIANSKAAVICDSFPVDA
jgi:hypothetical protein